MLTCHRDPTLTDLLNDPITRLSCGQMASIQRSSRAYSTTWLVAAASRQDLPVNDAVDTPADHQTDNFLRAQMEYDEPTSRLAPERFRVYKLRVAINRRRYSLALACFLKPC